MGCSSKSDWIRGTVMSAGVAAIRPGPDEDTVRDSSCWLSSSCVFLLYNLLLFSLAAVFVFLSLSLFSSSLSPASFLDFSSFSPPFLLCSPCRPIHYSSPSFSVSLSLPLFYFPQFSSPISHFLSSLPSSLFCTFSLLPHICLRRLVVTIFDSIFLHWPRAEAA